MSITLEKFFKALGLKPRRLEPIVEVGQDPEARAKTQAALPAAAVTFEPGRPLVGITTDDLDMRTGHVYANYLERRAEREAARQPQPAELNVINWDIRPR